MVICHSTLKQGFLSNQSMCNSKYELRFFVPTAVIVYVYCLGFEIQYLYFVGCGV
ncbi:uncharacterized protein BDW70DRAFT_134189 [Aspergillus foveolatus]|uniref:uncharacterized protein n=1 Tax=Aspergillus foveolatus TaxID=210207 RepID=UPI003CCD85BA